MEDKPALTYPTEYLLKVLGVNSQTFHDEIRAEVSKHVDVLSSTQRESHKDKYVSVSLKIILPSEDMLQTIFTALKQHSDVKLVL